MNILQKQFVSVFTKEPCHEEPLLDKKTEVLLSSINVIDEMIRNEMLKLDLNKLQHSDMMKEFSNFSNK